MSGSGAPKQQTITGSQLISQNQAANPQNTENLLNTMSFYRIVNAVDDIE